jgi:exopolyphosphatase
MTNEVWSMSMPDFLNQARQEFVSFCSTPALRPQPLHIVIGNEASDADSMVSSICLAYIESCLMTRENQGRRTKSDSLRIPVLPLTRADLETQRPETTFLFDLAGLPMPHVLDSFVYIDDLQQCAEAEPMATGNSSGGVSSRSVCATLMDHNRLSIKFPEAGRSTISMDGVDDCVASSMQWVVKEIMDHHYDEGDHTSTVPSENRHIAFGQDQALVASTCTLVVERLRANANDSVRVPAPLSVLLLGVILLDSVNMAPSAGKGTDRDADAINFLLETTDWSALSSKARARLMRSGNHAAPHTDTFFNSLQNAKFDLAFWSALNVRDALRLDFKLFNPSSSHSSLAKPFGISTVLMPLTEFTRKADIIAQIRSFMSEQDLDLLGVMCTSTVNRSSDASPTASNDPLQDGDHKLSRELLLCSRGTAFPLRRLVDYFMNADVSLQLEPISINIAAESDITTTETEHITIYGFHQRNTKASRKQVAPKLLGFFDSFSSSE